MVSTQFPRNLSTAVSETTTQNNLVFCYPHPSVIFKTIGTTLPQLYIERFLECSSGHRGKFCKHFGFLGSTSQRLYSLAIQAFTLQSCSHRCWSRRSCPATLRNVSYHESKLFSRYKLFLLQAFWSYGNYVHLSFNVDNDSNKCGSLHRVVLLSQIS